MRYAIVIEQAGDNFSGYIPDVPGCVATGATVDETRMRLAEALAMHLQGLREDGMPIPEPSTVTDYIAAA
jgi:predicted RNase H-like HicB family nuclease